MFVKKGDVTKRREGEYPQSCAKRMTAPSADAGFRACGHDQRTEPVWRLCDRPLEAFARSRFKLYGNPALAGRGGSVSRRDYNPATWHRTQLAGANCLRKETTQTPATLRERGSGGEALLLEKRPLPQNLHLSPLFLLCILLDRGGGGDYNAKQDTDYVC